MASSIRYKNERLLEINSSRMEDLAQKMLFVAKKNLISPQSNLIQLLTSLIYGYGSQINLDLNSKDEVLQFAKLAELAINSLEQEGYFDNFNQKENGKIINKALEYYKNFVKRLDEISKHEWKNDNLFINRANQLEPLKKILLYWAEKEKLNSQSRLMSFFRDLAQDKLQNKDINIHIKEDLQNFIKILELSIKTLIDQDYFFEAEEQYFLNYLQNLKATANDWDNAISDEWKQGNIIEEPIYIPINPKYKPKSIIKDLLKRIIYFALIIILLLVFLWLLLFIANFVQKF